MRSCVAMQLFVAVLIAASVADAYEPFKCKHWVKGDEAYDGKTTTTVMSTVSCVVHFNKYASNVDTITFYATSSETPVLNPTCEFRDYSADNKMFFAFKTPDTAFTVPSMIISCRCNTPECNTEAFIDTQLKRYPAAKDIMGNIPSTHKKFISGQAALQRACTTRLPYRGDGSGKSSNGEGSCILRASFYRSGNKFKIPSVYTGLTPLAFTLRSCFLEHKTLSDELVCISPMDFTSARVRSAVNNFGNIKIPGDLGNAIEGVPQKADVYCNTYAGAMDVTNAKTTKTQKCTFGCKIMIGKPSEKASQASIETACADYYIPESCEYIAGQMTCYCGYEKCASTENIARWSSYPVSPFSIRPIASPAKEVSA